MTGPEGDIVLSFYDPIETSSKLYFLSFKQLMECTLLEESSRERCHPIVAIPCGNVPIPFQKALV